MRDAGDGQPPCAPGSRRDVAVRTAGRHAAVGAFVQRPPFDAAAAAPAAGAHQVGDRLPLQHAPGKADLHLLGVAAHDRGERADRQRAGHAVVAGAGAGGAVIVERGAHIGLAGPRIRREDIVAAVLAPGRDGAVGPRLGQRISTAVAIWWPTLTGPRPRSPDTADGPRCRAARSP